MKFNKHILMVLGGFCSLPVFCQTDSTKVVSILDGKLISYSAQPLITDRPDATESPTAMPKGYFQIETGGYYESFEENGIKNENYTYNTTLVRYGLLKNLELRLGWDFVEGRSTINGIHQDNVTSGLNPLLLGFKTTITQEKGLMPEIGFLGHLYLPFTAGSDYKPETTGVDFRFSFAHSLSERSSIAYNLGAAWQDDSPETAYLYTIAYGYSITDKIGAYAELYGDFPENSQSNHFWDAGLTYLISNNVQLDTTFGTSITKGQDLLLSAGISFRIPAHNGQ
ncbi:MAG: transporter [Aquaticitalea sp.]